MKTLSILTLLLLALPAAAATYECTDRQGRRSYTSTPGPNCRDANLGKPSIYTAAPAPSGNPVTTAEPAGNPVPETAAAANAVSPAALRAAEERLAQAQKNLEEGRRVRYGNERNYARYLERIKGLEEAVKAAQEHLNQIKQPN